MATTQEHESFCDYVSLKVHFNNWKFTWNHNDPDYHYKKIAPTAIDNRYDRKYFNQLNKLFKKPEQRREFLITGFLSNRKLWIGDFFNDDLISEHQARMRKRTSLIYTFNNDIENIIEFMEDKSFTFKELIKANGQRPQLLKFKRDILGGISEETLAILDKFFKYTHQVTVNPLWDEERLHYNKYGILLNIDDTNRIKTSLQKLIAQS